MLEALDAPLKADEELIEVGFIDRLGSRGVAHLFFRT